MKMNKLIYGMAIAMTALFTACDQDNEAAIYNNTQGQGLAFINTDLGNVEVPAADPNYTITLARANASAAFSGKIDKITAIVDDETVDYNTVCTISDYAFEMGSYTADIKINLEKLPMGKVLNLTLECTDSLNLAPTSDIGTNAVKLAISKAYNWVDLGTGHYYSPEWWEEDFDVAIQKAEGFNQYKIKSLFQEGYDIQFEITDANVVIVPKQASWVHSSYGTVSLEGYADAGFVAGTYDPSTKTATMTLRHTVSAGSFGAYTDTLVLP
jgi:hypothetical protein